MAEDHSIVEYFAEHEKYKCGYCGNTDTNYSHGMWSHALTVQDYQDLLDRGWRRSGKYTYKPTMNQTCCPQYTIRNEVLNFTLRKSHKKVLKKVNKFLIDGIKPTGGDDENIEEQDNTPSNKTVKQSTDTKNNNQSQQTEVGDQSGTTASAKTEKSSKPTKSPRQGSGADPMKPPCKKKKEIRAERKLQKLKEKADPEGEATAKTKEKPSQEGKSLEEYLSEPDRAAKCAHKLEMRLVRAYPKSEEFEDSLQESFKVYHSYQVAIHRDPPDKPKLSQYTRFLVDSPLEIKLVRTHPEEDEFRFSYEESYSVYRKYQMDIHKDKPHECTKKGYGDFLVASPLEAKVIEGGLPMGYGSFHQQYILDGKIICVGVIDILPSLVSSKYLYYDPEYSFLSLGTYSALREIAFIRELNTFSQDMIYYYMGFYIHSCPKMKYKAMYQPSYLQCPETYTWQPVEKCQTQLDQKTFCRFAPPGIDDRNRVVDIDRVLVLHARQIMPYEVYKSIKSAVRQGSVNDEEEVKEYASFVGRTCAERMLLFRK